MSLSNSGTGVVELKGFRVRLCEPVLVRRSRWYSWFPSLIAMPNGHLLATVSVTADIHVSSSVIALSRSRDGGRTWEEPKHLVDGGYNHLVLPDGHALCLPYYLRPRPGGGLGAPCNLIHPSGSIRYVPTGVEIVGWPRPNRAFAPELGTAGFVFNGQTVGREGGGYLTTLYGFFGDDKRMSLVLAESDDGYRWRIRSVIAGSDCALEGGDGPSESALVRLPGGRLLCVFRLGSFVPYGRTWSEDDGRTWRPADALPAQSVEPSLCALPGGAVVLSGGRPGIFAWFAADPMGGDWQAVDIVARHNACVPESDRINPDSRQAWAASAEDMVRQRRGGFSSCYTEIVALDERTLLLIYDRLGLGWHAIPDESDETNSVWAMRLALEG